MPRIRGGQSAAMAAELHHHPHESALRHGAATIPHDGTGGQSGDGGTALATESKNGAARSNLRDKVPHKSYYWILVPLGSEHTPLEPETVVDNHGLPERVLLRYLQNEIIDESAVTSLPMAFILIVLYVAMALSFQQAHLVRGVEAAIDFDISENANFAFSGYFGHKAFEDVNNFADFWSWLRLGFTPLYANLERPVSEGWTYALARSSRDQQVSYLWHNRKIGPALLAQSRSQVVACPNQLLAKRYNMTCTETEESIDLFMNPSEYAVSRAAIELNDASMEWLNGSEAQLHQLEEGRWLDHKTLRAQVSFIVYNGPSDCLTLTNIQFLFARTGRIWKEITHRSFILGIQTYQLVWASLFYLQITMLFLKEVIDFCRLLAHHRCHCAATFKEYISFWNFIDWASIGLSYALLGFMVYTKQNRDSLKETLLELGALSQDSRNHARYGDLFRMMERLGSQGRGDRVLSAIYPICIMMRLFKAFSAQPRLAIVTRTLTSSATDLAHFAIVFLSVFLSFVLMGVVFFGAESFNFATLDRSTVNCFRALLGDFDVDEMMEVGRIWPTAVFYVVFMTFMTLIIFNMLIAILMDAYVMAKSHSGSNETLFEQTVELFTRKRRTLQGRSLSIKSILSRYLETRGEIALSSDSVVFLKDFVFRSPGLGEEQALEELVKCAGNWANTNTEALDLPDVAKFTAGITLELIDIRKDMDETNTALKSTVLHMQTKVRELRETQDLNLAWLKPMEFSDGRKYQIY